MILQRLRLQEVITPPKFLVANTHYLVIMGSVAYGASDDTSDMDIYGWCIPPKEIVFPHLSGEIPGFGKQVKRFEVWQEHHIQDPSRKREYDFSVYSIVKFFQLLMENNPNMVDSLFVPRRCILHCTEVANMVRDNRKLFLHKGSYRKFRGYAYSQMHKIKSKTNSSNPKRAASIEKYGFDVKFAYHVVRLALECEQILESGDLDLERDREVYKSVRRGDWTVEELFDWFKRMEPKLEELYTKSTLPHTPDEAAIKNLLMQCLEHHYGSIDLAVKVNTPEVSNIVGELQKILDKYS